MFFISFLLTLYRNLWANFIKLFTHKDKAKILLDQIFDD